MIHYVNGKEPVGITYCGGNIFTGEVSRRDRVTLAKERVTCEVCKLLLEDSDQRRRPSESLPAILEEL